MKFNEIMNHFNSLGFEIEQYKTEEEVADAMYQSLLEDGLVPIGNVPSILQECETAAKCMWDKHQRTQGPVVVSRFSDSKSATEQKSLDMLHPSSLSQTEVSGEPYVSKRTRDLEALLRKSREEDKRLNELRFILDTFSQDDLFRLEDLLRERLHGEV